MWRWARGWTSERRSMRRWAYARCDAILLTTDLAYVPSEEDNGRAGARPSPCGDGGEYDVVVVGAGPGGMGASLGAARNGARVALVFDRPVPGGNASDECATATSGDPKGVLDGTARPVGGAYHGWVSDGDETLPQSIRLDFPKPVRAREVRLVFDSDLTPKRVKERMPGRLVKSYAVEILVDGRWRMVVEEDENFLRHRIHAIPETEIVAVRVTVAETWGDSSARFFEIRVY